MPLLDLELLWIEIELECGGMRDREAFGTPPEEHEIQSHVTKGGTIDWNHGYANESFGQFIQSSRNCPVAPLLLVGFEAILLLARRVCVCCVYLCSAPRGHLRLGFGIVLGSHCFARELSDNGRVVLLFSQNELPQMHETL